MVARISPFPVCSRNNISNCVFYTPGFAVLSSGHMDHQNIFSFKPWHSFSRVTNHFFVVFQETMVYLPVSPWRSLRVNIQNFYLQALNKRMLREKQSAKIGLASIDEKLCVVFARDTNCLVCEEFCPGTENAIKVRKI